MIDPQTPNQVVFTNKARCRDCYRCVRVCPVKAIRMEHGQAYVVGERCIACGTCIRECPQGAKSYRDDSALARDTMAATAPVAASLAPSFAAAFADWERKRLPSALRKLGFTYVGETAIGAFHVAQCTADLVAESDGQTHICTACPAAVSYVEAYRPDLVPHLTPICSPMIAHARHIKATRGEGTRVIFIGPCVAKKAEADRPENAGLVDCVLTFRELKEWLAREGIALQECEESDFDEQPQGDARFFPLEGGSLRTACLSADLLAAETVCVSGVEEVAAALDNLEREPAGVVLEPLFCRKGCVGGPAMGTDRNLYDLRRDVLAYAADHVGSEPVEHEQVRILAAQFAAREATTHQPPSNEEIRRVLELTGKMAPEDELNCGACGYLSCRDKAIAVIHGMAEPEMCIPYMRRMAEQRTDRIIETSPNGIVILDERLSILAMNPAFRRMFMCTEAVLGKRISYLMDPDRFERLAAGEEGVIETVIEHPRYHLVCHEILYKLPEERQFVGIMVNITRSQADRQKLDHLRAQTVTQARELLEHQIAMAQQIGKYLGESAARGEHLVENLLQLAGDTGDGAEGEGGGSWLADTYTSK